MHPPYRKLCPAPDVAITSTAEIPRLDHREEHFFIAGPKDNLRLFLRLLTSETLLSGERRAVLYVHGATFPSALSVAHRFDGCSWRDALCDAGFDVWGLDFYGFGYSDHYPEMDTPADSNPPLCLAEEAAAQLAAAVRFILGHQRLSSLSLITHSWGSMAAGRFAGDYPDLVERLVLFAPIARRDPPRYSPRPNGPAWRVVSLEEQLARFVEDVPPEETPVLSQVHFDDWGRRYLDSDPRSRTREPAAVKVPSGPFIEILRAWHGELAYEPARVRAPVAILRGAWDGLATDADARWLFEAFNHSPVKRDVKIGRGTHLMHLETMRLALWRESVTFLLGDDVAPVPI
jgi:pimeloyl-ACP methyl ester carboxylesterase